MACTLCILALLCFAACAVADGEPEQRPEDLQLQQDTLSWLDKLQDKQESAQKQTWMDFLNKLNKFLQGPTDTVKQETKRRGLAARPRRPGCRFFFWKSFTSC
uniref:Somatostatin-like n=1 Tax=Labrus bergylta TaxID=56723 RepID=A0A3Q3G6Y5_9LABR|nr:somatostatin-like [Labrus bergylta]